MSFWSELRRRNVFKVGVAYAIVAWLLVQVAAVVLPTFDAPRWVVQTIVFVLILGFPVAVLLAWAYEVTPEGIKRTKEVPLAASVTRATGQKLNYAVTGLLVLAVAFLAAHDYLPGRASRKPAAGAAAATATQAPEAPAAPVQTVLPNSIAVLPFQNLSPDPNNKFFAAGIHDEILNQLTKLKNLNVIGRTSVSQYAKATQPVSEIAKALHVGTIMEGSVSYAEGRVAVRTQLIDAKTGVDVWSESYNRKFADIFAIQTDIAMNIANALQAKFSPAEQQAVERPPTSSPAAYALFLQAQETITTRSTGDIAAAQGLLDRAIKVDPRFARAYGLKAALYAASFENTASGAAVAPKDRKALERNVRDYADRALAIDPDDAAARQALRAINIPTWHWSAFEKSLEPGDVTASDSDPLELWVLSWMGKRDEAVRIGKKLVELNPTDAEAYLLLGVVQAYAGDRAGSSRAFRRGLQLAPALALMQVWLAYNDLALGNDDAALAELQLVEGVLGDHPPAVYLPELAYCYSRLGRPDEAKRLFDQIHSKDSDSAVGAGGLAMGYLAIGDQKHALQWLETVAAKARRHEPDQGLLNVMNLKMNFLNDPTLKKPAFVHVLSEIAGD